MSYAWCISSRCIASRFRWLLWDPGPSVCTLSVLVPAGKGRRFRERAALEYRIEGEPWEGEGAYLFLSHAHTPQASWGLFLGSVLSALLMVCLGVSALWCWVVDLGTTLCAPSPRSGSLHLLPLFHLFL